jgi:uncharacterized protein (TIGR00299 family) protein
MRIGYLDCFSGVSGDMWVGALLDAGLPLQDLQAVVASLQLPGVTVRSEPVLRASLAGTRFVVEVDGREPGRAMEDVKAAPSGAPQFRLAGKAPLVVQAAHAASAHAHRGLAEIVAIVRRAKLPAEVERRCLATFERIAVVEAKAHRSTVEAVHFHEVGAEDTIVDIVCACAGTAMLGIERLYSSAVAVGSGTVRAAHGMLPVPAPATLELLAGVPVRQGGLEGERTTPTGAALLRTMVDEFEPRLAWIPERAGYGAGTRDDQKTPNLLRLTLGSLRSPGSSMFVEELQCQLDTATGEHVGWLLDEAMRRGALDAFATAVQMKKGRPGLLFTALCESAQAEPLVQFLLEESGTLGVRRQRIERSVLERWQETRATEFGPVRFKCARLPSGSVVARPEDDDVRAVCEAKGLSRREVLQRLSR